MREAMTYGRIFEMDYLGRVMSEALRLQPPASMGSEYKVHEDISLHGIELKVDDIVTVDIWAIHHDAQ